MFFRSDEVDVVLGIELEQVDAVDLAAGRFRGPRIVGAGRIEIVADVGGGAVSGAVVVAVEDQVFVGALRRRDPELGIGCRGAERA